MKDDDDTLWLAYPNPRTVYTQNHFVNYGIKFDLKESWNWSRGPGRPASRRRP